MGPVVRREDSSRNKGANILNYVKGISGTYTDANIHLLAKIVAGPPELPIPPEPVYHPYELLRLTFPDGMNDLKLQADKDSQTDLSELPEVCELNWRVDRTISSMQSISEEFFRVKEAYQYRQSSEVRQAAWRVHVLARSRLNNLAARYDSSVELVREACRTQLANAIGVLRGLAENYRRRDASAAELRLERRIFDLESELQKKCLDIQMLRVEIKQLKEDKDEMFMQEATMIVSERSTPLPSPREPDAKPQTRDHDTQTEGITSIKESDDKQIDNLRREIEALKLLNQANQSRIEKSNGDRLTLQNELQSAEKRLTEKTEQVNKLSEQINKLNSELTKAKQQAKTAESKAAELLTSINALRSEKNRQEESTAIDRPGEKDKLKEIIETLREENQVLKRQLEALYLESSRKPKSVPQVTPSSDSRSAASVREQVLCTEVVRLRQELMQTRQTAEARIRSLRQRLTVVSEEMFLRQAKENQVAQIHMAGIAYADQYPEVNSSVVTNLPQTGLRQVYMENWNKTGHPSERISLLPPLKPP